jgi:hypothetical protein
MKTVTFSIRPLSEVVDDFAETFDAVRTGRRIPKKPRDEVGFTSIEAARNFLNARGSLLGARFERAIPARSMSR